MEKDSFNFGAVYKLLKRFILICCCVLMFSSVAGKKFTVKKCAIIGQVVKLFDNIDSDDADPSLYNETGIRIASWNWTTYTVAYMDPHYNGKLFMDKKRNIWMFVERKDAGRYYVKFGADLERLEVDIILIVYEELAEEQPQECQKNHPDFTRKESSNNGQMTAVLVITSLNIFVTIIMTNKTYIIDGWITTKRWIRKKFCRDHRSIQSTQSHDECTGVTTEGSGETTSKPPQRSKNLEVLPPESNGKDVENKAVIHSTEQDRRNMKSLDSASNDEHIELLRKRACGSSSPVNESEDHFLPMGKEKKKILIRETELSHS